MNHSFFTSVDSEEKAYWAGFLAADGYIRDGVLTVEGKLRPHRSSKGILSLRYSRQLEVSKVLRWLYEGSSVYLDRKCLRAGEIIMGVP